MPSSLVADRVAFYYPQHGRGIQPISFAIQPGEIVYFRGMSGCGKSTLSRCLTGLIPHLYRGIFEGSVLINDMRTDLTPLWKLTNKVGLVFQNPAVQILNPTVEEEIIFGLENQGLSAHDIRHRSEQAMQVFSIGGMRSRSPRELSGGEQQKLALAAITARQPEILVLDEPLSMLDTTAALEFIACIERLAINGTTILLFEHRQEYIKSIPDLRVVDLENNDSRQNDLACETSTSFIYPPSSREIDISLEISRLNVRRAGQVVLNDLSINIPGGQIISIFGPNGVGKTTLLRSLAGLQEYTGTIQVHSDNGQCKPELGLVFQNPDLQIFNPSVREEILYNVANYDQSLYSWLLNALDLERYEHTPPLLLSEGEKRRLALATMIMRRPQHGLLLDEPSLGQDTAHKALLIRLLKSLASVGWIIIMATHDLELATSADQMILLGRQGIIAMDTPGHVLSRADYWNNLGLTLPKWANQICS